MRALKLLSLAIIIFSSCSKTSVQTNNYYVAFSSTLNGKINFAGTTQTITGGSTNGSRYVDFTINSGSTTSLASNFELTNETTSSFNDIRLVCAFCFFSEPGQQII